MQNEYDKPICPLMSCRDGACPMHKAAAHGGTPCTNAVLFPRLPIPCTAWRTHENKYSSSRRFPALAGNSRGG